MVLEYFICVDTVCITVYVPITNSRKLLLITFDLWSCSQTYLLLTLIKKTKTNKNIQGLFDLIKAERHYGAHYRDKTSKIAFVHCRSWSIAHEIGFKNADFQLVMIAIYYNIAFTFCWCWQHKRKCNVYNTGCCKGNHFCIHSVLFHNNQRGCSCWHQVS